MEGTRSKEDKKRNFLAECGWTGEEGKRKGHVRT